jgi:hypothetical protein
MNKVSAEDFEKIEELELLDDCRVAVDGKVQLKKKGSIVKVGGNDKNQLLASGKGKRPEPKEEKKEDKK